jgi:hypothetical protein
MLNFDLISSQVKHNCNISDARYWGCYSPCGLLLRLRDLYKIEHGLNPWERVSHKRIGKWIEERERLWQELESLEFQNIKIQDKQYHPFDVKKINSILEQHGYVYGAGYGNLLKPVFILAKLDEKLQIGKYNIYILGREIARDLSTSPAMLQGNTILARRETMSLFFWSRFEEMKMKKCSGAIYHAFLEYGIDKNNINNIERLKKRIARIVREELSTYIYHEIGEASKRRVLGKWWKELLLSIPYSRAELFLRGLKDILADTCSSGMLSYIIKNKKAGSLSFYVAFLSGFRKIIFPDIVEAYVEFRKTQNWEIIEKARIEGNRKAGNYVKRLKELFDKGRISAEIIEQELMIL